MSLTRSQALDPSNLQIPEESERPWYMKGGQLYPQNSVINTTTGMRSVKIFPDELPGEDRIPGTLKLKVFQVKLKNNILIIIISIGFTYLNLIQYSDG